MKRFFWIFLLCVAAFHVNNTALLPDIMECRNLVTAREMVSDDAWLVPTMNGNLRLEKAFGASASCVAWFNHTIAFGGIHSHGKRFDFICQHFFTQ